MGTKERVDEAKKTIFDSPAAAEMKAKLREAGVKAGLKTEDIDSFMETALPQLMEVIDKIASIEVIGAMCTIALIQKGYRPYYGNHAGESRVALVTDPHVGLTHKLSTAVLMELDNWFQKNADDMIRLGAAGTPGATTGNAGITGASRTKPS